MSDLLRRCLQSQPAVTSKNGLPVFKVGDGAPVVPPGRARDILADEL